MSSRVPPPAAAWVRWLPASQLAFSRLLAVGRAGAVFFFSSRRRHTRSLCDWSSDVCSSDLWQWLEERLYYLSGDFKDDQTFTRLKELLETTDKERQAEGNFFFYLATAPEYFAPVVEKLGAIGLTQEDNSRWRRVVIEKPFGRDLESAKKLNQEI